MNNNKIYLDYAATTPIDSKVAEAMRNFALSYVGNASSVHSMGRAVAVKVDEARSAVAKFLHCPFTEIIFTSGATEANNIAIQGLVAKYRNRYPTKKAHIITSLIEHASVLEVIKKLEEQGEVEVNYLSPNEEGIIEVDAVKRVLRVDTLLVSIMYVNNEIGTIQPIRAIGKLIEKHNNQKEREVEVERMRGNPGELLPLERTYFHCDATQGVGYLNSDVQHLHVDMLSMSAHKIYGPTGVGVLYVKSGTPLQSIYFGGDQELSLRPGTHNAQGIVGCGVAVSQLTDEYKESELARLIELREYVMNELAKLGGIINGSRTERTPNNVHVTFPGVEGEMLMYKLDTQGICISVGSACSSGASEPSHVVMSLGKDREYAKSSVRITMGRGTTRLEIDMLLESLKKFASRN